MEESNIETHNTIKLSPRFTLHPAQTRRNGSRDELPFLYSHLWGTGTHTQVPLCPGDY